MNYDNLWRWVYDAPSRKPMGNLLQHMPNFSAAGHDAGRGAEDRLFLAHEHRHESEPDPVGVCRQMTTVEDATAIVHAPDKGARILERPRTTTGQFSWVTTVDHKKIAIMYAALALFFFCVGGIEALFIRLQLAQPNGTILSAAALQRVLHDARHHDGVPARDADRGRVR